MSSQDKANEILHRELAEAISQIVEFPEGLITVTGVDCASSFDSAKVFVSVLPDNLTGSALRALQRSSGRIMEQIKKRVKFRRLPRLYWIFDPIERDYEKMEKMMRDID